MTDFLAHYWPLVNLLLLSLCVCLLVALLVIKVKERSIIRELYRITKGYAEIATHRDDHTTRTVSEIPAAVEKAVQETAARTLAGVPEAVKQAVADAVPQAVASASESGTRLRIVSPNPNRE